MSDKNEDGDTSNESVQSDNKKNELEILAQLMQEEQEIDEVSRMLFEDVHIAVYKKRRNYCENIVEILIL